MGLTLVITFLLGMAIGFYHLIQQLRDIERLEKLEKEKNDGNEKRIKWLG